MQAVRLSCSIAHHLVIANRRFPFFRAYSFACNDAEVFA